MGSMTAHSLLEYVRRQIRSGADRGASAVEYALIVVAIAALIVAVVFTLGRLTEANYDGACSAWDTAAGTSDC
jgi:pilus assembly protein Flp/PilA